MSFCQELSQTAIGLVEPFQDLSFDNRGKLLRFSISQVRELHGFQVFRGMLRCSPLQTSRSMARDGSHVGQELLRCLESAEIGVPEQPEESLLSCITGHFDVTGK
jgi:hypothetical protein